MNAEEKRLEEARTRKAHWKRWGPYVSDRAWGTVREDYSATGEAWEYFPHDHARSRDRKSTRLNSSHGYISYAVFCLKKKKTTEHVTRDNTQLQRPRTASV